MNTYEIELNFGYTVIRIEPDGYRGQIAYVNTFEEALNAIRVDSGRPVVLQIPMPVRS